MADAAHPKTHVEDQKVKLPRTQPESPHHEGIDPLTESDTMYPREDTKNESKKLATKTENEAIDQLDSGEASDEDQKQADTVADQKAVDSDNRSADEKASDEKTDDAPAKPAKSTK